MPNQKDQKQIKCKGCGRSIPDHMYCRFCGKINWRSLSFELISAFVLAAIAAGLFNSTDKGLKFVGVIIGFIAFAVGRRAFPVLLSSRSSRIDPTSPLKKDKWLSHQGRKAKVGERSLTKDEWRSKYRDERMKKQK